MWYSLCVSESVAYSLAMISLSSSLLSCGVSPNKRRVVCLLLIGSVRKRGGGGGGGTH